MGSKSTRMSVVVRKPFSLCSADCVDQSRIDVTYLSRRGRWSHRSYCLTHIPKSISDIPGPGSVLSLDGVEVYSLRAVWQALTAEERTSFDAWMKSNDYGGVLPDDSVVVYKRDWDRWFETEMRRGK